MFKDKVKKTVKSGKELVGSGVSIVEATGAHVWDHKTDYMLAYTIILLFVMDRDLHRRIDHLENASVHVVVEAKDFDVIERK